MEIDANATYNGSRMEIGLMRVQKQTQWCPWEVFSVVKHSLEEDLQRHPSLTLVSYSLGSCFIKVSVINSKTDS